MSYSPKNWENEPSEATPMSAENLNHIEQGIYDAHQGLNELQGLAYGPLKATTVADMTDQTRVYVYTGSESGYVNGNWYYYNGSSWVSGGVYNAVAVSTDKTLSISDKAADAKVTGYEVGIAKGAIYQGDFARWLESISDTKIKSNTKYQNVSFNTVKTQLDARVFLDENIVVEGGDTIEVIGVLKSLINPLKYFTYNFRIYQYESDGTYIRIDDVSSDSYRAITLTPDTGKISVALHVIIPATEAFTDTFFVSYRVYKNGILRSSLTIPQLENYVKTLELERVTQTLKGLYGYTNIGVTWEQGSITATGEDTSSNYDSRLRSDDWIDISGYNTLVVSVLNGFRAYVVLANSAYGRIHESPSLWVTNATKFDVSTASYMRICFSKSNDITTPYATVTDAQNNFIACGITSSDFTLKRNDAFYSTLTPAYSGRYVFGKGKMWEYLWNTEEAYVAAGEDSRCWGIDGDVQFTSDNKLVMYHDKTVNYNGNNVAISSLTLEQVQSIVLTSGGAEYSIPTLEDFVKICRRYGKICMIETKGSTDAFVWNTNHSALLTEMVSMLEDYGMTDSSVFVVQFSDVVWLQDRYPNIACMTILDNNTTEANVNRLRNHPNVIEGGRAAGWSDNDTVKVVHEQGRKVMVYSTRPQTSSMIDDMRAINADAIFLFADPDV